MKCFTKIYYNFERWITMKKIKILLSLIIATAIFVTSTLSISAYSVKLTFFVPGDVDGNKSVDITDVTDIQLHLAELYSISEKGLLSADFNGDGDVDIKDVTDVQLYLANLDYTCVVYPDDGYLEYEGGQCEEIAEENKIEFEELLIDVNTIFTYEDVMKNGESSQIALIESADQFYSLFNVYSPNYDDEFFSESALVIWLVGENGMGTEREITSIGVKDNKLLLEREIVVPPAFGQAFAYWHYFYKVSKSDIGNVDEILSKTEVTYLEDDWG